MLLLVVGWFLIAGERFERREDNRRDRGEHLHLLVEQARNMRRRVAAVESADKNGKRAEENEKNRRDGG